MTNISKNGKTFRIGALLLVVALISTVMLSGTFAKYTSEYAGQDTALVAKWNLTMTDNANNSFAISPNTAASLDLFKHAYNGKIVASAGAIKIIAPGVKGSFVLNMTNKSDVAADITFGITAPTGNAAVPMEYSFNDDFSGDIYVGATALETALNASNIQLAETNETKSQTVYWRWAFDRTALTDASDTALGTASAAATDRTGYKLDMGTKSINSTI